MPRRRRSEVIREDEVGVYHVWVRCVRRAWLCGLDPLTGNDYQHRKGWIESRLAELARIFAIDACVYAVLSNHYHLLLRNRPDLVLQWSDEEVARRWWQLCPQRCNEDGSPADPWPFELRRSGTGGPSKCVPLAKSRRGRGVQHKRGVVEFSASANR